MNKHDDLMARIKRIEKHARYGVSGQYMKNENGELVPDPEMVKIGLSRDPNSPNSLEIMFGKEEATLIRENAELKKIH